MKKIGYAPPLGCVLDVDSRYHDAPAEGYFMDRSIYGQLCQVRGAVQWTHDGFSFDGVDGSYVDCGTELGDYLGDGITDISVTFRCRPDVVNGNDGLFSIATFSSTAGEIYSWQGVNVIYAEVDASAVQVTTASTDTETDHFVALTYDSVNLKMYVDAVLKDSAAHGSGLDLSGLKTTIGAYWNTPFTYDGIINKVRVFNRALTQQEIQAEMWRSRSGSGLVRL